jgi:hypothetical protein
MRLATALDEVIALQDGRATANDGYVSIVLLSRVIVRLGDISPVPPSVVAGLFASDFAYLQDVYIGANQQTNTFFETRCPRCGEQFGLSPMADELTRPTLKTAARHA